MEASSIKLLILGILIVDFLIERILDYLNIKNLNAALPKNVSDVYDSDEYIKSQSYQKEKEKTRFTSDRIQGRLQKRLKP